MTPPAQDPPSRSTISSAAAQAARDAALGRFQARFVVTRENISGHAKDTGVRVYEFEHGLVRQKSGEAPEVFRWDGIAEAYQSSTVEFLNRVYVGTSYTYTIKRDDGLSMTIKGSYYDPRLSKNGNPNSVPSRYEALGRSVVAKVSDAQLPRAVETLTNGGSLTFGDITISAAGVKAPRHKLVPWSEIEEVKVDMGKLRIKRPNSILPLTKQPVAKIPNFPLFMTLAEALRRSQR